MMSSSTYIKVLFLTIVAFSISVSSRDGNELNKHSNAINKAGYVLGREVLLPMLGTTCFSKIHVEVKTKTILRGCRRLNKRLTKFSQTIENTDLSEEVKLAMISFDNRITCLNYVIANNNKLPVGASLNYCNL